MISVENKGLIFSELGNHKRKQSASAELKSINYDAKHTKKLGLALNSWARLSTVQAKSNISIEEIKEMREEKIKMDLSAQHKQASGALVVPLYNDSRVELERVDSASSDEVSEGTIFLIELEEASDLSNSENSVEGGVAAQCQHAYFCY